MFILGKIQYVDKKTLKKRNELGKIVYVKNPNPEVYIVKGLHEAIIDEETFQKAQVIYKGHQLADTRTKEQLELKNPLSSLIKCKVCGKTMKRITNGTAGFDTIIRLGCRNYDTSSSSLELVEEKLIESLKIILNDYKLDLKNATNKQKIDTLIQNTDKQIELLKQELEKANSQKSKLYDLLEQGIYDNNTFIERSNLLAQKLSDINTKIHDLNNLKNEYEHQKEKKELIIPKIENVIELYPYATIEQKNRLLKSCIKKVEYYKPPKKRKTDFELTIYPLF